MGLLSLCLIQNIFRFDYSQHGQKDAMPRMARSTILYVEVKKKLLFAANATSVPFYK